METKTILAVCAVLGTLLATGLCIGALAIPIWWNLGDTITIGLFKSCVTISSFNVCANNSGISGNFQATRWLVVGACVLLFIALFLGFLLLCCKKGCLAMTACVFDVVAGLSVLAAVIITAVDTNDSNGSLKYGIAFILACVCLAIAIIAGILFAFAKPKRSGTQGRVIQPI